MPDSDMQASRAVSGTTGPAHGAANSPPNPEAVRRPEPWYSRPHIVGIVVAGAMALVVIAVFSMAELADRSSNHAGTLHALDAIAIEVEATRHQLAVVTVLGPGESSQQTLAPARRGLQELRAVTSNNMALTELGIVNALRSYVDRGDELAAALEREQQPARVADELERFAAAHNTLSEQLTTERADSLAAVNRTNRLLSRFGALGGGLVAFVVPLVGLYVQRRVARRRLASYEFDADVRRRLAVGEMTSFDIANRIESIVPLLDDEPEVAAAQLQGLLERLRGEFGAAVIAAQPTDVVDVFTRRPEFPGLRRRVDISTNPVCEVDPGALSAAFNSMEWAASRAGAHELALATEDAEGDWQRLVVTGQGLTGAETLAEVAGPLDSVESALASIGVPATSTGEGLTWTVDVPLAVAGST